MGKVIRSILAVITGFIAASAVMMVVETINGRILYPELGKGAEGLTDREQIRALMASAPVGAFVVVLIGWALGGAVGGFLATLVSGKPPPRHAVVLGVLLTLAGIANNLMLPPPAWFWIATLVVFLPAAYLGAKLVPQRAASRATPTE